MKARLLLLALLSALFAGCGSGGSSGDTGDSGHGLGPGTGAGSATVTVSTQESTQTVLYAVEFSLRVPAGVTVTADAMTGEVPAGTIAPLDSRAMAEGKFTPATATSQGLLKVNIVDPLGFTTGDLATIKCSVADGTSLKATGFTLDDFSARDANGAPLPGVTPRFTIQTQ